MKPVQAGAQAEKVTPQCTASWFQWREHGSSRTCLGPSKRYLLETPLCQQLQLGRIFAADVSASGGRRLGMAEVPLWQPRAYRWPKGFTAN